MAHTSHEMVELIASLPPHIQRDIKSFMDYNSGSYIYDEKDVVKAWLTWNGIIGYEDSIVDLVLAVYKKN